MVASPELIIDGTSSQENIEGTHERVNESIKKELEWLKNEIWWSEFYSSDENWKVEYKMDVVQKYLETKKDKSYVELLNSKNTAAWIMAVQIVLCSVGYDVGKVDWILKNKWAKTSKTIEQIIKFQSDNWLKPDWKPGWKTIKKLLEKLWSTDVQAWNGEKQDLTAKEEKPEEKAPDNIVDENNEEVKDTLTKAEFDLLCIKASLSDEEMRKVIAYANENEDSRIALGVYRISQNQLKELWKIEKRISLIRMENITSEQLKVLSNAEELALNSLREMTPSQAESISKWNVKKLEILSLRKNMTNDVVSKLAKSKTIKELWINGKITSDQKKTLEDNDILVVQ